MKKLVREELISMNAQIRCDVLTLLPLRCSYIPLRSNQSLSFLLLLHYIRVFHSYGNRCLILVNIGVIIFIG